MLNTIKWVLFWIVVFMISLSVIIELTPTKEDDKYLPFINDVKQHALDIWDKI